MEELFGDLSLTTPITQPPASTSTNNSLFEAFSNPIPPPTNSYGNFYVPPAQPSLLNTTPTLFQQPQRPSTPLSMPLLPQQQQPPPSQQQLNSLSPTILSPVAPPTVTSPFADLDIFGGLSSGATAKTTKELFFPPSSTTKTMQQLQMEKQVSHKFHILRNRSL